MSTIYKNEQGDFWAGNFETEYNDQNKSEQYLVSNIHFFSNTLKQAIQINFLNEFP